jgi:aminopeptidase N
VSSLRQDEAERRAALVRPLSTTVRLDLTGGPARFDSRTTLAFEAHADGETFVDLTAAQVRAATLDGAPLELGGYQDGRLPLPVTAGSHELVVDAVMSYSHDGEGLVRHVDPADGAVYLYAMSFLDAAPRWFACFDQPDLKLPFTLDVRCPEGWTVAGNGPAVATDPGRWTISQPRPVATYMTTLVAGPYHSVRGEHDGIPLALHARASLAACLDRDAEALLAHTARCLDEFHRLFGTRYPWGEYHQAFVPDFNAGAMENPGCVTFRDELMFRSHVTDAERIDRNTTVAHEMAHMWFGDLVTMRWWDDLWLNESFAEYLGHRVCASVGEPRAWVSFGATRKAWGYAADRRPSTHPVAGNGARDAASALNDFDGISYAKGAAALRQLAARLGDEVFLTGLRAHIEEHAFANATLAELLAAWHTAGATDIGQWAEQWLRTAGLDTLRADQGSLVRTAPADRPARRDHALEVGVFAADGALVDRRQLVVRDDVTALDVAAGPVVLPNADDRTWAKTELSPAAWDVLPSALPALDAPARVVVWNALQLAVADAELDPAAALNLVASAVPHEPDEILLASAINWARAELLGAYLPPSARADAERRLRDAAEDALAAAQPGSGRRLVALRGVISFEHEPARLHALLRGRLPDGTDLDPDLRWRAVTRLCALGEFDTADVDRELAADTSSEGTQRAAQCRATIPDATSKGRAWELLVHDPECPNSILYATAAGFWQPDQTGLTAPYVARYFAEIASTAGFRSGWVVKRVAGLAFPRTAVEAATLDHAEALLARPDLASGIRRAVVDAADDLRRAVASRVRFAPAPVPANAPPRPVE